MDVNKTENSSDLLVIKLFELQRAYGEYAKAVDLTIMSLAVLEIICKVTERCTQKLICELLNCPKQSVNLAVKSLWESGYVELKELHSDRRNKHICLTPEGQQYAAGVMTPLWEADKLTLEDCRQADCI